MRQVFVIAPSNSMVDLDKKIIHYGVERLREHGYTVNMGENVYKNSVFDMGSVSEKMADFSKAMQKKKNIILPVYGGYNSSSLLSKIDYCNYDSILAGYSDITALMNGIYAKTERKSIHGLSFASLCEADIDKYSLKLFFDLLDGKSNIKVTNSEYMDEDFWFMNTDLKAHKKIKNMGWTPLIEGEQEGILLGGNIETLLTLAGTEFFPDMQDAILLFEYSPNTSIKRIFSFFTQLEYMNVFKKIKGIIMGIDCFNCSPVDVKRYLKCFEELSIIVDFPIIANTNFSHFNPIYSLVIGGRIVIHSQQNNCYIKILEGVI